MSTFTEFNGPQSNNVRATDLIALADAYNQMTATLQEHLASQLPESNTHNVKDYIDAKVRDLNTLIDGFNRFLTRADADTDYATKQALASVGESAQNALTSAIDNLAIDDYLKKSELTSHEVVELMREDIERLAQDLEHVNDWKAAQAWECPNLRAQGYVEGLLKAKTTLSFVDKVIASNIGGADDVGVYYIIAMLTGVSGAVSLKYTDGKPFAANIQFAVMNDANPKGQLSVVQNNDTLNDLAFMIVKGTDQSGESRLYLAVQSTDWISKFASTDGYGLFDKIDFEVSCVNAVPADSSFADWARPNGACETVLCKALCGNEPGVGFSGLASIVLNKRVFMTKGDPYMAKSDLSSALTHVGQISQWDEWDENNVATNVPAGFHACDGTDVLPEDDVSDEFRAKHNKYPLFSFSIIRVKPFEPEEAGND